MINCIDKNKKVIINFNSWRKFPLDNRQPSKALKFNCQPSNGQNLTVNRQSYTPIDTLIKGQSWPRPSAPMHSHVCTCVHNHANMHACVHVHVCMHEHLVYMYVQ